MNLIKNDNDTAAIIVEPIMGNIGFVPPKDDYLKFLRQISEENNIILIFDEVITGFRIAEGGAQEYFDVIPDIVTLGKILGGGFPMGAIAGKKELMEMIAPSGNVYQAGTFNGNPISVTAGLAMLKQLDNKFYAEMNKKGEILRTQIQDTLDDNSLNFKLVGLSSMFQIYFTENEVYDYVSAKSADTEIFGKYFHTLLKEGVFIPPSQFECCFISLMHSEDDIQKTAEIIGNFMKNLK
jgi:glutamate-1-semialdehyde 2,1-aminomutase